MKMLRYTLLTGMVASLSLFFPACTSEGQTTDKKNTEKDAKGEGGGEKPEKEKPKKATVEADRQYNDIARLIAGMSAEEGSVVKKHTESASWKQYAQATDAQWQGINQSKLPKMQKWAGEELSDINKKGGTLFYPFGGADALHAATFFPEFDQVVMMGLEPIGNMPDFDKIAQKGTFASYFAGIRRSLVTILQYSFFKTNDMANDFTGRVVQDVDGTLPVLLLFLERTNHRIINYEKVAINPEGKLIKADESKEKGAYIGTKITYRREANPDEAKTLYYFSVNLSNDAYNGLGGLSTRKDLKGFIESLDITATYLKSASYLMYNGGFSMVKNLILDKSSWVLQDDSGMPLANFTAGKHKWDLTFYGVYAGPISLFASRWQQDMKVAYTKKEQVRPLPFGIGYQFAEGTSNLMLAKKK
ncbi:MAG: hypothetical protein EAZ95_15635 [Bacteroidetes bacterium]|nr:MAG: hypothetical protein EAZ95_15635 [Bacteroidota bacterium]